MFKEFESEKIADKAMDELLKNITQGYTLKDKKIMPTRFKISSKILKGSFRRFKSTII
ncbi:MAG: hypothetical protein H5T40_02185 [Methanobacteriales archaeon]|nr:hypothetical protein [Methanobacteriales archaeon]MBC7118354.1 hypothetical protein [Methanobacteriaceae archaeon]